MTVTTDAGGTHATDLEGLLDRLGEPRTLAALNTLVDNAELLAVLLGGLDGLARKGDVISDTLAEVIHEAKAAGRATGLDVRVTTRQLATLIPTFADAAPTISRVVESPVLDEEPLAVVGLAAVAISEGYAAARAANARVGIGGLVKATRDADVQRGLGFLIEVARARGRRLDADHATSGAGQR